MLIFSVSFQFDHVLLLGSEKKFVIMVDVFVFAFVVAQGRKCYLEL